MRKAFLAFLAFLLVPTFTNAEINDYQSSFNRDLLGQTALMDDWTLEGSDKGAFVPVWGRGVSVGIAETRWLNRALFPFYEDIEAREVRYFNNYLFSLTFNGVPFADNPDNLPGLAPFAPISWTSWTLGEPQEVIDLMGEAGLELGELEDALAEWDISNPGPGTNPYEAMIEQYFRADVSAHVNQVAFRLLDGALGARGCSKVQSLPSFFLSSHARWMAQDPVATDYTPADVYNLSAHTETGSNGQIGAMEQMIDTYETLVVMAAGNGVTKKPFTATVVPGIQNLYNGITVGASPVTFGTDPGELETCHSTDGVYGAAGRLKPDITASVGNSQTSFITPTVTATCARLKEAATYFHGEDSDVHRSEVMKAVLLSGATKDVAFHPDYNDYGWDRTPSRPMDERFGAGVMNIYHSVKILEAGEQPTTDLGVGGGQALLLGTAIPPVDAALWGWSYSPEIAAQSSQVVTFAPPSADGSPDFHFTLVWNIKPNAVLANLDLELVGWAADGTATVLDSSTSTIDNVEHFWVGTHAQLEEFPDAVAYSVIISNKSNTATDFALAWRCGPIGDTGIQPTEPPALVVSSPQQGGRVGSTIRFAGTAEAESGIVSVKARVRNSWNQYLGATGGFGPNQHQFELAFTPKPDGSVSFDTTLSIHGLEAVGARVAAKRTSNNLVTNVLTAYTFDVVVEDALGQETSEQGNVYPGSAFHLASPHIFGVQKVSR